MKKIFIIHPVLFAAFPILFLYDHNKDMAQLSYLPWPLFLSLALAMVVFALCSPIFKNRNKSALAASLFLTLFFSFGHILPIVADITIGPLMIYNHFVLLFFYGVIYAGTAALVHASRRDFRLLTSYLNTVAVILVIMTVYSIGRYEYQTGKSPAAAGGNLPVIAAKAAGTPAGALPDIYYIILDGYARADILAELYHYDNSAFLDFLRNRGFFIASSSHANYAQTYLSLSSALNFNYLDNYTAEVNSASGDRKKLKQLIRDNKVYAGLKEEGYTIVAYPSTWAGYYDNLNADVYLHNDMDLNEFDNLLLSTTPLYAIYSRAIQLEWCRKKFFYTLDHLPELADQSSPTFTYVHLLIPHPPFLFDRYGNGIEPNMDVIGNDGSHYFDGPPAADELALYRQKYVDQLVFLNGRIETLIDEVLKRSPVRPIIILQSDHGPGSLTSWESPDKTNLPERLSNLNVYLLPDQAAEKLYPAITPVNTFRIIFNHLFNAGLPLLDDRSYFSTWSHPYEFIDVTDQL